MRVSELIKLLEQIKDEHGDLNVYMQNPGVKFKQYNAPPKIYKDDHRYTDLLKEIVEHFLVISAYDLSDLTRLG